MVVVDASVIVSTLLEFLRGREFNMYAGENGLVDKPRVYHHSPKLRPD